MAIAVADLLKMSQTQLDDLFKNSEAGPIPDGPAEGTAIIAPGTTYTHEIAKLVNVFAWQGKTFDGPHGVLRNRILPLHLNAIVAEAVRYQRRSSMEFVTLEQVLKGENNVRTSKTAH